MVSQTRTPGVSVNEVSGQPNIIGAGVSLAGFLGRTKRGPTDQAVRITSFTQFKAWYGDYYQGPSFSYVPYSVKGYFDEGGTELVMARAKANDAVKASGDLSAYGMAAVAGATISSVGPFDITPGQTLVFAAPDGGLGGDQVVTFNATQATRPGSGSAFGTIAGAETLLLKVDGGSIQTITFQGGDTTAAKVEARINATLTGGAAVVNGTEVDIRSDKFGTGSSIQITGGSGLAKIGHSIGTTTGTGAGANIHALTAAETIIAITAIVTGQTATVVGGAVRVASNTVGAASSVQVKNTSTATGFGFDNLVHSGSNSSVVSCLTVRAQNEGAWGNDVQPKTTVYSTTLGATLANGATSVVLASVRDIEPGDLLLIVDPSNNNTTVVHVYAITVNTRTVHFRAATLTTTGTPLANGSSVTSSSMHRRVTTIATTTGAGDTTIAIAQAAGIVQGATITIDDGTNFKEAKVLGVSGNTIRIDSAVGFVFAAGTMLATQEFFLQIFDAGKLASTHEFLSMESSNVQDYVGNRLAGDANESIFTVEVTDLGITPTPLFHRAPRPQTIMLTSGDDGSALTTDDLIGDQSAPSGIYLFDEVEDLNRFCAPGITAAAFVAAAVTYAESQIHNAAITYYHATPFAAQTEDALLTYRQFTTNVDSSSALLYGPWVQEIDPQNGNGLLWIPPEGHVLGQVSNTVATRGVHVPAANVPLNNVLGLSMKITDAMQASLNTAGINVIRAFRGQGIRIWGARTESSLTDGRQYANVRELLNFVKLSFITGMRFAVFQPNQPSLWRTIERTGIEFLQQMWRNGQLFPDDNEREAYFVKCDNETNTPQTRAAGQVISEVGVNAPFPAEFVVFNMGVWNGGSSIAESLRGTG